MSCGISVMEMYGARMLNSRNVSDVFSNSDYPLNLLQASGNRLFPHWIYGNHRDSDENKDTSIGYPVLGMPLHRSPAVLAALSGLAKEEKKEHGNTRPRVESTPGTSGVANPHISSGEKVGMRPSGAPSVKHFPERRKMKSYTAPGHRESARVCPYGERPRAPLHYVMKDSKTKGIYTSPSYPSGLTNVPVATEFQNINKSFSSPGNLSRHLAGSSREAPWLTGDPMHGMAISSLSNAYTKPPTTQLTFSSNMAHPTPTTTLAFRNRGPTTSSSRGPQNDNFRRLMVPKADKFSEVLSPQDIALQKNIRDSLASNGVCVIDGLLGIEKASEMKREASNLHSNHSGGVVRGDILGSGRHKTSARGDVITWVDGTEIQCPTIGHLCQKMDKIIALGGGVAPAYRICGGTRAMVARYPGGGAQYKLHVDNPNKDGRCLTCIYYLNEKWDTDSMGGMLRIHAKARGKTAEVAPVLDRLAVFYSDGRNPHEVLKCYADRYAITLWYFDLDERARALERMDSRCQSTPREIK